MIKIIVNRDSILQKRINRYYSREILAEIDSKVKSHRYSGYFDFFTSKYFLNQLLLLENSMYTVIITKIDEVTRPDLLEEKSIIIDNIRNKENNIIFIDKSKMFLSLFISKNIKRSSIR